jgi:kynureninase
VSHYRAAEVFNFFNETGLGPDFLRQVSQHQVNLLLDRFQNLDLPPRLIHAGDRVDPQSRAGFLVLYSEQAAAISKKLAHAGVMTDYRGNSLRLGPAPYLSDKQLTESVEILGNVCREFFLI